MFISLPLWQRPRVPLGWDQVSLGWTRTSRALDPLPAAAFFARSKRVRPAVGGRSSKGSRSRGGGERRGKSCFWPSGALRGPDLRKFLQLPVYRTRVSCDNIGVWPAFLTAGREGDGRMEEIRSKDNPRVQLYMKLASQKKAGPRRGSLSSRGLSCFRRPSSAASRWKPLTSPGRALKAAGRSWRPFPASGRPSSSRGRRPAALPSPGPPRGSTAVCKIPESRFAVNPAGKYIASGVTGPRQRRHGHPHRRRPRDGRGGVERGEL